MDIRSIAIYLPQFHPVQENDEWWGKGFTEWTNVTKAKPLFKGHYQPQLPADLGFYDLRIAEVREEQAAMARAHGIHGFCYYHYWFNGKRILERPFNEVFESGKPDFPFMLCWANENWTRVWDGGENDILLEQKYSETDDVNHIRALLPVFKDSRYIKVDGKPFFLFYRPSLFPDIKKTIKIWREEARLAGIPDLHLGYMQSFSFTEDPVNYGFDCAVEFHPNGDNMPKAEKINFIEKLSNRLNISRSAKFDNTILDYSKYVENEISNRRNVPNVFPGLCPGWDNSARRQTGAYIMINSSPEQYGKLLKSIVERYKKSDNTNKFIFINAWNEWAEGNHLEPCQKWGRQYLEVTRKILKDD